MLAALRDENRESTGNVITKIFSIVKKFRNAWDLSPWGWVVMSLISTVTGLLIDPLFLYIPIINEDDKCVRMDETMKNIALILRSTTDFAYVLCVIFGIRSVSNKADESPISTWKRINWYYHLIAILAILPFPHVAFVVFVSKMVGSKSLTPRKFVNILLLAQYVPRTLRIYISAKGIGSNLSNLSLTQRLLIKGAFNFFFYIIAGHVFGAFWYFFSIFRETACWHRACNSQNGCHSASSFYCQSNSISTKNLTYFNQFCPVNPPNSTVYDFGIFANAIESGTLGTTNFLTKFSKCFWWGLRNLSSLGSNLETSSDIWENFFAVFISLSGLLLFVYLIGNLQIYLQLAKENLEDKKRDETDLQSVSLMKSVLPSPHLLVGQAPLQSEVEERDDTHFPAHLFAGQAPLQSEVEERDDTHFPAHLFAGQAPLQSEVEERDDTHFPAHLFAGQEDLKSEVGERDDTHFPAHLFVGKGKSGSGGKR